MHENVTQEKIWNIPNTLTFLRVIITFVTIYFVFADFNIWFVAIAFGIGMITDFLDGFIARNFNMQTEFGRQFDVVADRFLMIGVALALVIKLSIVGQFTKTEVLEVFLVMTREIVASPVVIFSLVMGRGILPIPKVRFVGKLTTFLQGVTFPLILLSIFNEVFRFSIFLAFITAIVGLISGIYYVHDSRDFLPGGKQLKNEKPK